MGNGRRDNHSLTDPGPRFQSCLDRKREPREAVSPTGWRALGETAITPYLVPCRVRDHFG